MAAVLGNCSKKIIRAIINRGADPNAKTNKKRETALMTACLKGNIDVIKVLLNAGADPNITDVDRFTCLQRAIYRDCSKEILMAVLDHGADVNATNKYNETALMAASKMENIDAISVLLNAGANPHIANIHGCTWLHCIVWEDCNKEVLQAIIDHGADVNATDKSNKTALMIACEKCNDGAINVLLTAGADPNITSFDGFTCLQMTVYRDCIKQILQAVLDHGADVNATNKHNETALMAASKMGNIDAINVLLNAGANPHIANINGCSWLHCAVLGDSNKEVLQAIIDHGADVNATDKSSKTALMIACEKYNAGAINVLLDGGADPNITGDDGFTCLQWIVYSDCNKEVLQALIDHGADVNATDKNNQTTLMIACKKRNEDAINVLLNARADPNIGDIDGDTCLNEAVGRGCTKEIIEEIIHRGANVNASGEVNITPLIMACHRGNKDAIDVLLNGGADPTIGDIDGNTCLHEAVAQDCTQEVIEKIICHGADVNATSKDNVTALMRACKKGNIDAINILLNAGADPDIAGNDGYTCFHFAAGGYCSKETLQTIINHSTDVNAAIKNNETTLMKACYTGNIDAINILLNAGANLHISDNYGDTWLHHAAFGDCTKDVFQTIIDHGADVNATDKNNKTALVIACDKCNEGAINVLLNAGADPNISDDDGFASLQTAVYGDCSIEILQAVLDHGADVNATNKHNQTALIAASKKGSTDAINVLLNAGANPHIAKINGFTWIHCAVLGDCNKEVLQAIIDHGTDVNTTDNNNVTALMIACERCNEGAINVLFNAGADANLADVDGFTCLQWAVGVGCSKEILQAILDHGADVNATSKHNQTALMVASKKANIDAINVLLRCWSQSSHCKY